MACCKQSLNRSISAFPVGCGYSMGTGTGSPANIQYRCPYCSLQYGHPYLVSAGEPVRAALCRHCFCFKKSTRGRKQYLH